jgi:cytochrome c peroxidase
LLAAAALAVALAACGGGREDNAAPQETTLSAQAALGELIFHDVTLSASGQQACASCHVEERGHAPDNALPAQLGGPLMNLQGARSAPSMRYLAFNTSFSFDGEGTPTGGFFWDGRAASLMDQAREPFLNPVEMANTSKADVIDKLSRAPYAPEFQRVFGADIFSRVDDAYDRVVFALQRYQLEDVEFRPFSSKYDEFLRGNVQLGEQELRGLALYNSPAKGNCAACHPSAKGADGSHPLFTDFTYDNLGVPRNPELTQNADPNFFDLGLCARADGSLAARTDLCGAFKVPSLRNVGLRQVLFHNSRFKSLKTALTFYVQRDTSPELWYPRDGNGNVVKFDDLPDPYKANVNTTEAPYNRQPGDAPALTDSEIDDVVVFLNTLSDGFVR